MAEKSIAFSLGYAFGKAENTTNAKRKSLTETSASDTSAIASTFATRQTAEFCNDYIAGYRQSKVDASGSANAIDSACSNLRTLASANLGNAIDGVTGKAIALTFDYNDDKSVKKFGHGSWKNEAENVVWLKKNAAQRIVALQEENTRVQKKADETISANNATIAALAPQAAKDFANLAKAK